MCTFCTLASVIALLCVPLSRHHVTKLLKLWQHSTALTRLLLLSINTVSFHFDIIMQSLWAYNDIILTVLQWDAELMLKSFSAVNSSLCTFSPTFRWLESLSFSMFLCFKLLLWGQSIGKMTYRPNLVPFECLDSSII